MILIYYNFDFINIFLIIFSTILVKWFFNFKLMIEYVFIFVLNLMNFFTFIKISFIYDIFI